MTAELFAYQLTANVRGRPKEQLRMGELHGPGAGGPLLDAFDDVMAPGWEFPPPPEAGLENRTRISTTMGCQADPDVPHSRMGRVQADRTAVPHDLRRAVTTQPIRVTSDDWEGRPIFFYLLAPPGTFTALLLTERTGGFGIVTSFWNRYVIPRLRQTFSDTKFDFGYYNPRPVWEEYLAHGQGLEGLQLRRSLRARDEAEEVDGAPVFKDVGRLLTRIDRATRPARETVASVFQSGDRAEALALLLPEEERDAVNPAEYDEVAVDAIISGRKRRVRLGREHVPPIGYPVTVDAGDDGYPSLEGMAAHSRELIADIGGAAGLRMPDLI